MKRIISNMLVGCGVAMLLYSCFNTNKMEQGKQQEEMPPIEAEPQSIDYESVKQLSKFNTLAMGLPDSLSYYGEIKKADLNGMGEINYTALDSLYATGVDVNETLYYEGGGGFGFKFSLSRGFQRTYGGSSRMRETTPVKAALKGYDHNVTFRGAFEEDAGKKSFDLIHFLLSRGVDPNTQGVEPLYDCIKSIARSFDKNEDHIRSLIDLYKFYGFDMSKLDLSASDHQNDVLHYLISEGSHTYDMNTFSFESQVRLVYEQRRELQEQGVSFNFAEVSGRTFPFASDTSCLQMFLEMGLSPNHITPKGKKLRDDFGKFAKESLTKVLDRYTEKAGE